MANTCKTRGFRLQSGETDLATQRSWHHEDLNGLISCVCVGEHFFIKGPGGKMTLFESEDAAKDWQPCEVGLRSLHQKVSSPEEGKRDFCFDLDVQVLISMGKKINLATLQSWFSTPKGKIGPIRWARKSIRWARNSIWQPYEVGLRLPWHPTADTGGCHPWTAVGHHHGLQSLAKLFFL